MQKAPIKVPFFIPKKQMTKFLLTNGKSYLCARKLIVYSPTTELYKLKS